MSICRTGFATLSTQDDGWYGKGMYYTSSALYSLPYYATKPTPALIICWILPGNTYPVIENPVTTTALRGLSIRSGYQSHYVVISGKEGLPIVSPIDTYFDEIVIGQESQVLPVFLITFSKSSLSSITQRFLAGEFEVGSRDESGPFEARTMEISRKRSDKEGISSSRDVQRTTIVASRTALKESSGSKPKLSDSKGELTGSKGGTKLIESKGEGRTKLTESKGKGNSRTNLKESKGGGRTTLTESKGKEKQPEKSKKGKSKRNVGSDGEEMDDLYPSEESIGLLGDSTSEEQNFDREQLLKRLFSVNE